MTFGSYSGLFSVVLDITIAMLSRWRIMQLPPAPVWFKVSDACIRDIIDEVKYVNVYSGHISAPVDIYDARGVRGHRYTIRHASRVDDVFDMTWTFISRRV